MTEEEIRIQVEYDVGWALTILRLQGRFHPLYMLFTDDPTRPGLPQIERQTVLFPKETEARRDAMLKLRAYCHRLNVTAVGRVLMAGQGNPPERREVVQVQYEVEGYVYVASARIERPKAAPGDPVGGSAQQEPNNEGITLGEWTLQQMAIEDLGGVQFGLVPANRKRVGTSEEYKRSVSERQSKEVGG